MSERKRLTFNVDPNFHAEVEAFATRQRTTIGNFCTAAIRRAMRPPLPLYCSRRGRETTPGIALGSGHDLGG